MTSSALPHPTSGQSSILFLANMGRSLQSMENNKDRMRAPYDAETPIETLFRQINDANKYSIFAKKPMQESDLIQAGEALILRAGAFASEYKDWRSIDEIDRTWEFFQQWWQEAYNLREETQTTAISLGFGGAAVQQQARE